MKRESAEMMHCVGRGGYDTVCNAGAGHIFSIRTIDTRSHECPLATFDLRLSNDSYGKKAYKLPDEREFYLSQLKGPKNSGVDSTLSNACNWLLRRLASGELHVNPKLGGISQDGKQLHDTPEIIQRIGYWPTPEKLEVAFQEYNHKHLRRAAIGHLKNGDLTFDPDISKNRFIPDVTFTTADGRDITVGYQDLNAELFLAATGLREKLHDIIRTHYPERAAKLEPVWAEQPNAEALWREVEAAKQRAKYAHNFEQAHPEPSGARIAGRHANGPLPRIHQPVHGGRTGDERELSVV